MPPPLPPPPLSILRYPHAALRRRCESAPVDDAARNLAAAMREAMLRANGVGLAAPQVGRAARLLVADVSERRDTPLALANPQIVRREDETVMEEGCLSVPGVTAQIVRARAVVVRAVDMRGEEVEVAADGLLARCLQHEIDHLDGVLFFDHLSSIKRERLLAKYKKVLADGGGFPDGGDGVDGGETK